MAIYEIGKNLIIVKYSALDGLRSCASESAHVGPLRMLFCAECSFSARCSAQLAAISCFAPASFARFFLISGHLGEGLVQLLSDGLELVLLAHQLVLQPVNLHMSIK